MSYNLLDEHWIPVAGHEPVSLQAIFSDESLRHLGGNPVEKISVMNLLLAISQAACTPDNEEEWRQLGADLKKFGERCLSYLRSRRDLRVCNFLWAARSRLIDVGGDSVTK